MRAVPIVVRVDGRYHARVKAERDALAELLRDTAVLLRDAAEALARVAERACCQEDRDSAADALARIDRAGVL
jgi:hypothetical protein